MTTNTVTATTSSSSPSSAKLTAGAFKIATWSHILAVLGVIGSIAVSLASNQPLLYAVFGQSKGAMLTLTAIAISHAATTITAYGDPVATVASTVSLPNISIPSVTISTAPPTEPGPSAAVVEPITPIIPGTSYTNPASSTTMSITTTEGQKTS